MKRETGEIILLRKLDREVQDVLSLDVLVEDSGNPPLNDSGLVTLSIIDENDNSPVIHPSTIEAVISEA